MAGIGGGCRISALALLLCAVLLSATMASGIRTGVADGTSAPAGPAAAAAQGATRVSAPPIAAVAATAPPAFDDTLRDSKRKVPNGPDPIHNRRARWGDAPAKKRE